MEGYPCAPGAKSAGFIEGLLKDVPIPRVIKVRQRFPRPRLEDVEGTFLANLKAAGVLSRLSPGMSIAVGVGSRGITNQPEIVRLLVRELKAAGTKPFLFPAMGSHGGATAPGQVEVLERMGITEETVGAPILATMETVKMGEAENSLPVWFDAHAARADGIVLINRVKPHVAFRGRYESGLMKMIAIGLGKQKGADACHHLGMGRMEENIVAVGRAALLTGRILFGVALLENGYHETSRIEVIPGEGFEERELELQEEAKRLEPRILFDDLDVLVIDEIGKDISGTGFDTNVVGRYHTPYITASCPRVTRLAILDLTALTHGNANGLGIADFTTLRVFKKFDFEQTYPNSLTSTVPLSVKIPMVLPSDRLAIQAAIKTCNIPDLNLVGFGRIKNTSEIEFMEVSENLLDIARGADGLEVLGSAYPLPFDEAGNLLPP